MPAKQLLFGEAAHGGQLGRDRGEGNFGYNAATGAYGDLVAMGVLDPCKVTRTALQNAASIAGQILTTDCMIAQLPEKSHAGAGDAGMPE